MKRIVCFLISVKHQILVVGFQLSYHITFQNLSASCNELEKPKSMCSTLQGSYICTKDICMPDDKLQCDKLATWVQLKDDPRIVDYLLCFGFGMMMVAAIVVFLYYMQ